MADITLNSEELAALRKEAKSDDTAFGALIRRLLATVDAAGLPTLRDQFAMAALTGLLAGGYGHGMENAVKLSFKAADFAMAARQPEPVKA